MTQRLSRLGVALSCVSRRFRNRGTPHSLYPQQTGRNDLAEVVKNPASLSQDDGEPLRGLHRVYDRHSELTHTYKGTEA